MSGSGRLIAVVGPSGVGKDSVMAGLVARWHDLVPVRRVITRKAHLGGEAYEAVSVEMFEARAASGAFCLSWAAHGLRYGIPATVLDDMCQGRQRIANLSRSVLEAANRIFPNLTVLQIAARPETLAQRLAHRGREAPTDIARRLVRPDAPLPVGLDIHTVSNDGPLDETVTTAMRLLQPRKA